MILPQISYIDGGGSVTFVPQFPPKGKLPVDALEATRHDSITSIGHKQSVTERVDSMNVFDFPNVPSSDIANWQRFMAWVLQGNSFNWAFDSTQPGTFETYTIEDMSWVPKFLAPGWFSFSFKVRKVVP